MLVCFLKNIALNSASSGYDRLLLLNITLAMSLTGPADGVGCLMQFKVMLIFLMVKYIFLIFQINFFILFVGYFESPRPVNKTNGTGGTFDAPAVNKANNTRGIFGTLAINNANVTRDTFDAKQ